MIAILEIERRNDDVAQRFRLAAGIANEASPGLWRMVFGKNPYSVWVAKVVPCSDPDRYEREFVRPKNDYSRANSKGSRGVFALFSLSSGSFYEVKTSTGDRYFVEVRDWNIVTVDREVVLEWLRNNSE